MINVSNEFKQLIDNDNRNYISKVTISLSSGDVLNVDNSNIWDGGISFENATSSNSEFSIGSCVMSKAKLVLNNMYEEFSGYDFYDALIDIQLGLETSAGIEYMRVGRFTVEQPTFNGSLITLSCIDNMWKFEKDFADVPTAFPNRINVVISDICMACGVEIGNLSLIGNDYIVNKPSDEDMNCREVLGYLAQMMCCFCKISPLGKLDVFWYGEGNSSTFDINHINSINVSVSPITITGLDVCYGKKKEEFISVGTDDYKLTISNNPFITTEEIAREIGYIVSQKLVGLELWKYNISALNAPYVEAGDLCTFTDTKGKTYQSLISSVKFTYGKQETFELAIKEPSRNNVVHYSENVKTITETKKIVEESVSTYGKAIQDMTNLSANAMGFFQTVEKQEDGSSIVYLHNKPTLEESMIIYKETAEGFFVSQDGGQTYSQGFDSEGNALVNILSAIGIRFDWARGGTLTLGGENNIDGQIMIYNADGINCGVINNTGIAIYSPTSQLQIIMSPVVGFIMRDANGNEYYGLSYDEEFFLPPKRYSGTPYYYPSTGTINTHGTYSDGTPYNGINNAPLKFTTNGSAVDSDSSDFVLVKKTTATSSPYDLTYDMQWKYTSTHTNAYYSEKTPEQCYGSQSFIYDENYLNNESVKVIQLPDSFKGKDFEVVLTFEGIDYEGYKQISDDETIGYIYYSNSQPNCTESCSGYLTSVYRVFLPTSDSILACIGSANYLNEYNNALANKKPSPHIDANAYPDNKRELYYTKKEIEHLLPSICDCYEYSYDVDKTNATITVRGSAYGAIKAMEIYYNYVDETNKKNAMYSTLINECMKFRVRVAC